MSILLIAKARCSGGLSRFVSSVFLYNCSLMRWTGRRGVRVAFWVLFQYLGISSPGRETCFNVQTSVTDQVLERMKMISLSKIQSVGNLEILLCCGRLQGFPGWVNLCRKERSQMTGKSQGRWTRLYVLLPHVAFWSNHWELADPRGYHFTVTTRVLRLIHVARAMKAGDEKCNFIWDQESLEICTLGYQDWEKVTM